MYNAIANIIIGINNIKLTIKIINILKYVIIGKLNRSNKNITILTLIINRLFLNGIN